MSKETLESTEKSAKTKVKAVKKNAQQTAVNGQLNDLLAEANVVKPKSILAEETEKVLPEIPDAEKKAYQRLYRKEKFMDDVLNEIYLDKNTKVKEEKPQTLRVYRGNVLKFGTLRASFEMNFETVYVIEHNNKLENETEMLFETVSVLQGYNINLRR